MTPGGFSGSRSTAPASHATPSSSPVSDAAYASELDRVAALGNELPRREVEALYSLLARRSHPAMGEVEFHAVKNQVMDKLLDQRPLPPDLGRTLVALFRDRGHAELLRNYSLQHFEPYLRARSIEQGAGEQGAGSDVAAILAAYRSALGETRDSIAGVALLGLERATASGAPLAGHADRALALRTAVRLAGDAACDVRSRLAAVQVCAVANQADALPAIRALAADPATTTALRAAALHALGSLGDASDQALLRAAAAGAELLRPAAIAAALTLERRLGR